MVHAMKNTSKILPLLVASLLWFAPSIYASETAPVSQDTRISRMKEMREQRLKQLDETLGLTPEQKARINAIWDKAEADAAAARQDAADAKLGHRLKQRKAIKAVRKEVRGVLTPEQQKKFDALPAERRGPHSEVELPAAAK
jgi:Spy/CpxP family protein refolding chaperone